MSGEVTALAVTLVACSSLRVPKADSSRLFAIRLPLVSSGASECHRWWWALKSPRTKDVSLRLSNILSIGALYPLVQLLAGGIYMFHICSGLFLQLRDIESSSRWGSSLRGQRCGVPVEWDVLVDEEGYASALVLFPVFSDEGVVWSVLHLGFGVEFCLLDGCYVDVVGLHVVEELLQFVIYTVDVELENVYDLL